jgi:hypothetical protein
MSTKEDTSAALRGPALSEGSSSGREAFERYFLASRKGRGPSRAPTFAKLGDGTYADDHTQRHWWTWQQAQAEALRRHDDSGTPSVQAELPEPAMLRGVDEDYYSAEQVHACIAQRVAAEREKWEPVAWQQRYLCPDEGPSIWQHCNDSDAVLLAKRTDYELRRVYAPKI